MKTRSMICWTWLLLVVGLLSAAPARAFYNPQTGHWLSRDPLVETGGLNIRVFVNNDPLNMVDPLGLADWRLDMSDHGGPHIQNGDFRYDAIYHS